MTPARPGVMRTSRYYRVRTVVRAVFWTGVAYLGYLMFVAYLSLGSHS